MFVVCICTIVVTIVVVVAKCIKSNQSYLEKFVDTFANNQV